MEEKKLEDLSKNVLCLIFNFLDLRHILSISQTCKKFNNMIKTEKMVWQKKFEAEGIKDKEIEKFFEEENKNEKNYKKCFVAFTNYEPKYYEGWNTFKSTMPKSYERKVVFVGPTKAGKTYLLLRIHTHSFPTDTYIPTVMDTEKITYKNKKGTESNMWLWDTPGDREYDHLRPLCFPQSHLFVLVFDRNDQKTWKENRERVVADELIHHCPDVPIFVVMAKSDLEKQIERSEIIEWCKKHKNIVYSCSLSSRSGRGVTQLMEMISEFFEKGNERVINQESGQKKKCLIF